MFKFIPNHIPEDVAHDIKTIREELANMLSHGLGIFVFLLLSPLLLYSAYFKYNYWYFTGCVIFCVSLLMVYTSSTLYHSMYTDGIRKKMRILDHISIYFLIAGSYTPFIFTHFKDFRGWTILGILWTMTLLGSVFKYFFTHKYKLLSTLVYVVMGWMALFIMKPLMQSVSSTCFQWIVVGGAFYTIGVIFYLWERLYHNHFIWHLFVLGGSISHFLAVYFCLS